MKRFKELLSQLKRLNLPNEQYAVFGSGPLAIRGLRESNDIDIIVKPRLWKELIKKYPVYNKEKLSIKVGDIEIFNNWLPWIKDSETLIDDADIFNGIRFVKLKYVLIWKKAFGREKDKEDIRLIEDYLKESGELSK